MTKNVCRRSGATCSGKTTLAKFLRSCLPNSFIIHQDDFAPPQELVPYHPVYNVQDWDDPPGAIDWSRLRTFLHEVKETGSIPASHKSHDHLNEQRLVPLEDEVLQGWKNTFEGVRKTREEQHGERIIWGLVDGFLLYWDREVVDNLDVRIFLRVPEAILKQRRHERHGYHTAVQSDPEGTLWRDPPNYWEQIVYPAYVRAHENILEGGNVENGAPNGNVERLLLLQANEMSMTEVFNHACTALLQSVNASAV
ncbi:P-loop containing nucleoside triphosphate hydrolase protein [Rickenella mellea]|uniref:P-loop containing nucleoside triphosphate hydrolase protein n=1 Tax=Rickenella mellea TaxID=50990 RepID=A0A4Y7PQ16_9AGAM|nr:P-loop containing nucleoside triphosphate hydrolase protein [Rickenella mellea]